MMRYFLALLFCLSFFFNQSLFSQTKSDLEQKKQQLAADIKNIELLIDKSINKKRELLTNVENLRFKIKLQQDLIININNQLNLIVEEIKTNNIELNTLLSKQVTFFCVLLGPWPFLGPIWALLGPGPLRGPQGPL